MSFLLQLKKSGLYIVICLLVVYIIADKTLLSTRQSFAVSEQSCQCPEEVGAGAKDQPQQQQQQQQQPQQQQQQKYQSGDEPHEELEEPVKKELPPNHFTTSTAKPAHDLGNYKEKCPTCYPYDLNQENNYDFQCVQMRFTPPAPVCLYPLHKDIYVSASLANYGTWEAGMVQQYQRWLEEHPGSGVIDVGANLGVYSLVAAAMGRHIVSVEPNIENVHRYHKAIRQGQLQDRIVLLQNAVGDSAGVAKIVYSGNNQGDTRMKKQDGANVENSAYDNEQAYTKMITMDDLLLFCDFKEAIMKIDIQGFEHRAFVHADRLFSNVQIHKVLMEWDMMKPIFQKKGLDVEEYELVEAMISFFIDRGYTPKNWDRVTLSRDSWNEWPFDIVWHKERNPTR
jgi:FkbM family methyltransferase